MNGPTRYIFRVEGIELRTQPGARVDVTPRGNGVVNEVENYVLAFVPSDEPSRTYRVVLQLERQRAETTIDYKEREQARRAPSPTLAIAPTSAPESTTTATPRVPATVAPIATPTAGPGPPAIAFCPHASAPYLSGTIRDAATGIGIEGVLVQTIDVKRGSSYDCRGYADVLGRYRLPRGNGTYRVLAATEPGPYGERWWDNAVSWWGAADVVVNGTDVTGIDIALTPGFSIGGQFTQVGTGLPLQGAKACVYQVLASTIAGSECLYARTAFADASGRYSITNLSAGTYSVCFGLSSGADCTTWWRGAAGAPAARATAASPIRLDASVTGIDATLSVYAIRGRVVDAVTGNPIERAVMAVYAAASGCGNETCNPISFASFDGSGRYTAYAPAGTYRLEVSAYDERRGVRLEKWWRDASSFADATPLVLSADVEGVDLALSEADTPKPPKPTPDPCTVAPLDPSATGVDGYVLWGTTPLGGVRVELRAYAADGGGGGTLYGSATTDADGYYRITEARTAGVELWIPRIAGYNMPYRTFNFGPCGPDRLLRPNQIQRLREIELERLISGISVASGSSVPALPLTVTWNAEPQVTAYCADLRDTTTQAALGDSTCPRFQGATLLRGPSYTTPRLVAGHQYVLSIRGLLGQTPIYFGSTTFAAR